MADECDYWLWGNNREVSVVRKSNQWEHSFKPPHFLTLDFSIWEIRQNMFTISHFWEPFNWPAALWLNDSNIILDPFIIWVPVFWFQFFGVFSCLRTRTGGSSWQAGCLGNGLYNWHWGSVCLDRVGRVQTEWMRGGRWQRRDATKKRCDIWKRQGGRDASRDSNALRYSQRALELVSESTYSQLHRYIYTHTHTLTE